MKLSTRTRYGMRALVELAQNAGAGALQLRVIAQRQGISIKYLEQLMATLKSAGLVRSIRGSKGGYMLAKPANEIKLSEIFDFLEGPVATTECVQDELYCRRAADCVVRQVWVDVQRAIRDVLESITLEDLANRAKESKMLDYQI